MGAVVDAVGAAIAGIEGALASGVSALAADAGIALSAGLAGDIAGGVLGAGTGALIGGGVDALTGKPILPGIVEGGLTGGFIGGVGPAIGGELGGGVLGTTAGDVLAGAAGGALGSAIEGQPAGQGALSGALAGGAAGLTAGALSQMNLGTDAFSNLPKDIADLNMQPGSYNPNPNNVDVFSLSKDIAQGPQEAFAAFDKLPPQTLANMYMDQVAQNLQNVDPQNLPQYQYDQNGNLTLINDPTKTGVANLLNEYFAAGGTGTGIPADTGAIPVDTGAAPTTVADVPLPTVSTPSTDVTVPTVSTVSAPPPEITAPGVSSVGAPTTPLSQTPLATAQSVGLPGGGAPTVASFTPPAGVAASQPIDLTSATGGGGGMLDNAGLATAPGGVFTGGLDTTSVNAPTSGAAPTTDTTPTSPTTATSGVGGDTSAFGNIASDASQLATYGDTSGFNNANSPGLLSQAWDTISKFSGSPVGKTVATALSLGGLAKDFLVKPNVPGMQTASQLSALAPSTALDLRTQSQQAQTTAQNIQNQASAYAGTAGQMQSYLLNGTLPPAYQAAMDRATEDAVNIMKSSFASRGMPPGSSTELASEAAIRQNAIVQSGSLATQLFNSGLTEAQLASGLTSTGLNAQQLAGNLTSNLLQTAGVATSATINAYTNQNNQTGQAIANLASQLGGGNRLILPGTTVAAA